MRVYAKFYCNFLFLVGLISQGDVFLKKKKNRNSGGVDLEERRSGEKDWEEWREGKLNSGCNG